MLTPPQTTHGPFSEILFASSLLEVFVLVIALSLTIFVGHKTNCNPIDT